MRPYLLLTPGPLTTSETVKEAMLSDWCTWDEDYNVGIVEEIRKSLVEMATKHPEEYTSVLMQGSGTYCVEAVLGSALKPGDKLLIFSNGAYGNRMGVIADRHGIAYDMVAFEETMQVDPEVVEKNLSRHGDVTHVAFVHCYPEPTAGIGPCGQGAWQETDCGCDEQFRRCAFGCAGTRHRFPHQQCEQMYPGRARFRLYHRPPQ